jgi:acyl-CoA thioester hydrolase
VNAYLYTLEMSVRDYECDMQGIVNNAVYQNYLEHARHMCMKKEGIDFKKYTLMGVNFVVVRAEVDYKHPLTSGDSFFVGMNLLKESRLRLVFYQDIFRLPDHKPVLKAKIIVTALNERGKPEIPAEVEAILKKFLPAHGADRF